MMDLLALTCVLNFGYDLVANREVDNWIPFSLTMSCDGSLEAFKGRGSDMFSLVSVTIIVNNYLTISRSICDLSFVSGVLSEELLQKYRDRGYTCAGNLLVCGISGLVFHSHLQIGPVHVGIQIT